MHSRFSPYQKVKGFLFCYARSQMDSSFLSATRSVSNKSACRVHKMASILFFLVLFLCCIRDV
jgi:hypothetical protein